jgi:hypothetical protein
VAGFYPTMDYDYVCQLPGGDQKSPPPSGVDGKRVEREGPHHSAPSVALGKLSKRRGSSPFLSSSSDESGKDNTLSGTSTTSSSSSDEELKVSTRKRVVLPMKRSAKNNGFLAASIKDGVSKIMGDADARKEMKLESKPKQSLCARVEIPDDAHFPSGKEGRPNNFDYRVELAVDTESDGFWNEVDYEDLEDVVHKRFIEYSLMDFEYVRMTREEKAFDMRADAAAAADLKHADPLVYDFQIRKETYTEMSAVRREHDADVRMLRSKTVESTQYTNCRMSHELVCQVISGLGVYLEESDDTILRRIKTQTHNCAASLNLNRYHYNDVYMGTVYYVFHYAQSLKKKYRNTTNQVFQESHNFRDLLSMDIELSRLALKRKNDLTLTRESFVSDLNKILEEKGSMWESALAVMCYARLILTVILSTLLMCLMLWENVSVMYHLNRTFGCSEVSDYSWMNGYEKILNPWHLIPTYLSNIGLSKRLMDSGENWNSVQLALASIPIPLLFIGIVYQVSNVLLRMNAIHSTRTFEGSIRVATYLSVKSGLISKLLNILSMLILVLSNMYLLQLERDMFLRNYIDSTLATITWLPTTPLLRVILLSSCLGPSRTDFIDIVLNFSRHVRTFTGYLIASMVVIVADLRTWLVKFMRAECLVKCALVLEMVSRTTWCTFMSIPSWAIPMSIVLLREMIASAYSVVFTQPKSCIPGLGLQLKLSDTLICGGHLFVVLFSLTITLSLLIRLRLSLSSDGRLRGMLERVTKRAWNYSVRKRYPWLTSIRGIRF